MALVVRNLSVDPAVVTGGSEVQVSFTIANEGDVAAPTINAAVFLRTNSEERPAPSDVPDEQVSVPALAAGASSELTAAITVGDSSSTPPGNQYVWVIADNQGWVRKQPGVKDWATVELEIVSPDGPVQAWVRQLGTPTDDRALVVAAAPDGGAVVAGTTHGIMPDSLTEGTGTSDVFITRLAADGASLWMQQLGSDFDDYVAPNDVAMDAAGNVVVVGDTSGDLTGEGLQGASDAFIASLAPDGTLNWITQFGTDEADGARTVALADDGSILVAGSTAGSMPGASRSGEMDVYLTRFDTQGERSWTVQFGSADFDLVDSLFLDASGNIVIRGLTYGSLPGNTHGGGTDADAFVGKVTPAAEIEWLTQLGSDQNDSINSMDLAPDGSIVVGGTTDGALPVPGAEAGSAGGSDAFLARLSAEGDVQWVQQFGTAAEESLNHLAFTPDGAGIVVAGWRFGLSVDPSQIAFVGSFSAAGAQDWLTDFGSQDRTRADWLHVADDGSIAVAGYTSGQMPGSSQRAQDDVFLSEFSSSGERQRTRQFGSRNSENPVGYALAQDGGVIVVGITDGTLEAANAGKDDAFVVKFSL